MKNNREANNSKGQFSFLGKAIDKVLAVKIGLALVGVAVIIGGAFVFLNRQTEDNYTYLPKRSYVLAEVDPAPPENLAALLNSVDADADELLNNDAMVEQLLAAETLSDVVNSRLSINNLRSINVQLEEKLAEKPEDMATAYIADNKKFSVARQVAHVLRQTNGASGLAASGENTTAMAESDSSADGAATTGESTTQSSAPDSGVAQSALPSENSAGGNAANIKPLIASAETTNDSATRDDSTGDNPTSDNATSDNALDGTADAQPDGSAGELPVDQLAAYNNSAGGESLFDYIANREARQIEEEQSLGRASLAHCQSEYDKVERLNQAISELLEPANFDEIEKMPSAINIKTIYDENRGLVHLLPAGDWIPEDGFKLYRVVNGDKQLIESRAAYQDVVSSVANNFSDGDVASELFSQAALTVDKQRILGMDRAQFNAVAYRMPTVDEAGRFSSEDDFLKIKERMLTVPAEISQKIPQSDSLVFNTVLLSDMPNNARWLSPNLKMATYKKFSVKPAELVYGIDELKTGETESPQYLLAKEIMSARQQIATLSFVNDEFAEAAGFLVKDDLSALGLQKDDVVEYIIETSAFNESASEIRYGRALPLSKPQNLLGYGVDGKAMLRWQSTLPEDEKKIVSGYLIERRLAGESDFRQVNDVPVVISYVLDETNNYFETPVFFEDENLENGQEVTYRIRSLDIFGRKSAYSDEVKFKVEKITPPDIPSVGKTVFSADFSTSAQSDNAAIGNVIEANAGKNGIAIPIFSKSLDTSRFTIYRAVSIGAQPYSEPEVLANLMYQNEMVAPKIPKDGADAGVDDNRALNDLTNTVEDAPLDQVFEKTAGALQGVVNKPQGAQPNLVFYDSDVVEGATYKYWVSAWDDWNNESGWSQSAMCAVKTDVPPADTAELNVEMLSRGIPDFSKLPPGIYANSRITPQDYLNMNINTEVHFPAGTSTDLVSVADQNNIIIGQPVAGMDLPPFLSTEFNNLPSENLLHVFVAIKGEDVAENGFASLNWPPYLGEGLAGYEVYRPLTHDASLAEMQRMTRAELLAHYNWERITSEPVLNNQLMVGGLSSVENDVNLFLICLKSTASDNQYLSNYTAENPYVDFARELAQSEYQYQPDEADNAAADVLHSGFVKLNWPAVADPQVQYYRVYRAEVPSFKQPVDEATLQWTMIGDNINDTTYTDPVEQSHAHYYYYKINTVSPWGVESQAGKLQRFRVPSTMPPQMPNLLVPMQRKDGVEINFSAVPYCDRYVVYRTAIDKVNEDKVSAILPENVATSLFKPPVANAGYLQDVLSAEAKKFNLNPMTRLNTIDFDPAGVSERVTRLPDEVKADALRHVYDEYGPLVLMEYRRLPYAELLKIEWEAVGELPADYDTVEAVDPATGLLKPLSIIDSSAEYGVRYLYTVQAWNDDDLGSCRPEPVEATPRRSGPFNPLTGLVRDDAGDVAMRWNPPTMPNLTAERCLEETVGYVVYRADREDGEYLQVSPLLFDTAWVDEKADRYANNYYRVKVLDSGGYFSEFSSPLLIKDEKSFDLVTFIPTDVPDMEAPAVKWGSSYYEIELGVEQQMPYLLSGTEPFDFEVKLADQAGNENYQFLHDEDSKRVTINHKTALPEGVYTLTITAKNNVGEASSSCRIKVVNPPVILFDSSTYTMNVGESKTVDYKLSGSEPIEVEVLVLDSAGRRAKYFVHDAENKQITLKADLSAGSYVVRAIATNGAGEDTAQFNLDVAEKPTESTQAVLAPEVSFYDSVYRFSADQAGTIPFHLEGTAPIELSAVYKAKGGNPITLQVSGDEIVVPDGIKPNYYTVTLTARNAAGQATANSGHCKLSTEY